MGSVSTSWPVMWASFLVAYCGRAFLFLAALLLLEGQVLGWAPAFLRSTCWIGVFACFATNACRFLVASSSSGAVPDMEVKTQSGKFRDGSVPWVACGMRGWRDAMEDAHVAEELSAKLFPDCAVFAVLDGHGGSEVSTLASCLLVRTIEDCASRLGPSADGSAPLAQALEMALPEVDNQLRAGSMGLGWTVPLLLHPFAACGSTACVAAVDFSRSEVHVANIGDSRALLIRDGKAIALSEDHKPENPGERSRIKGAGGQVIKVGPCHRVDGNLNLSRALGDFHLKANSALPPEKQKVIAYPDCTRTPFVGGPQELLVLACDGLFEKCSNQAIADLIWPRFVKGVALEQIGTEVLHACCARSKYGRPEGEGTDNETVVIIRLPPATKEGGQTTSTTELKPGQEVEVHGLESEAGRKLNGQRGIVEGQSATSGRFEVKLSVGGSKSFKAENLLPVG